MGRGYLGAVVPWAFEMIKFSRDGLIPPLFSFRSTWSLQTYLERCRGGSCILPSIAGKKFSPTAFHLLYCFHCCFATSRPPQPANSKPFSCNFTHESPKQGLLDTTAQPWGRTQAPVCQPQLPPGKLGDFWGSARVTEDLSTYCTMLRCQRPWTYACFPPWERSRGGGVIS